MSMTIEKMLQELRLRGSTLPTPLYIINRSVLEDNIHQLYDAFQSRFEKFVFGYSYKTNYAGVILEIVRKNGGYAEVVSPMELTHAQKYVSDDKIIYNGVIPDVQTKVALAQNGAIVNVENLTELRSVNLYAEKHGIKVEVGIRINLHLDGVSFSRFGIEITPEVIQEMGYLKNIRVVGIHCHVTKSRALGFWHEKARQMSEIAKQLGARYIDFGGNMYGPMNPELAAQFSCSIPTFADYADCLHFEMSKFFTGKEMPIVIVECGTPIISNAQSLLTSVVDIKTIRKKTVCTVDAKKLDISVIGDSGKQFPYYVINQGNGKVTDASIYGCTCLEFDQFIQEYTGPLDIGDRILFDNIGSYSNVLSPKFIQGTPAMVLYDSDGFHFVKLRDSADTVFGEYL